MKLAHFNLRIRIFLSMLVVILISFLLTGAVTVFHFKRENENYHQERLKRKQYSINSAIQYFLSTRSPRNEEELSILFDDKICELADINSLDINIYGISGNLLITSNAELRDEGITPMRLDQEVLRRIRNGEHEVITYTREDSLMYLSIYDYFVNAYGEPIGIVGLPYFETDSVHRQELREFLKTLGEIYLLIFIVAVMLGYFLTTYISSSITRISQKLKAIRLNKKNEPLEWHSQDEIGELVEEYNRMVAELEKNAIQLAQSERESAWKEMARQVAHEIKNPLTPMRLMVQHFQRSAGRMDDKETVDFAESLLIQIDSLSSIAEAFSRFANMPELKNEPLDLRRIVESSLALVPEAELDGSVPEQPVMILGDREQLVRVMNNLLKNAIQAVPYGRKPEIKVRLYLNDDRALVEVEDNGVGIDPEQHEKIFEPNFTTKSSGMGLGLAMVRNIIKAMKGDIGLRSVVGKGTVFFFTIPLQES